jgi:hypothetical protein
LIFGLEYALHLPVYNNVRAQVLRGHGWAGAVTLSFEGALRMLTTVSKPVRMPSYRPSLSGQLFYAWHREHPLLFGLRSSLYHYSNGQERCSFDETLTDTSRACLTIHASPPRPVRWRWCCRPTGSPAWGFSRATTAAVTPTTRSS